MKRETEKVTAASGDALRQLEHQTKVVRGELKTSRISTEAYGWVNHDNTYIHTRYIHVYI